MMPRTLCLVLIGVLSGMVAWLATTWYIRQHVVEPPPVAVEELDASTALRGSIEGIIASRTGEPITDARVCATAVSPRVLALEPLPRCTQTDGSGRYLIGALLAGAYRVVATAPAYRPGIVARELTVMPNERRKRIDLTLVDSGVAMASPSRMAHEVL